MINVRPARRQRFPQQLPTVTAAKDDDAFPRDFLEFGQRKKSLAIHGSLRRANRGHAERGQSSGGPGPRSESDELRRPVCGVAHPVFDRVSADKHCVIVV